MITLQEFSNRPTVTVYSTDTGLLIGTDKEPNPSKLPRNGPSVTYGAPPATFALGQNLILTYNYVDGETAITKTGDPYASEWEAKIVSAPMLTEATTPSNPAASRTPSGNATESSANPPLSNASVTPSPTVSPKSGNKGVSSGAAAGVAIGCLIAGALIAGIAVWFYFRRARKSYRGPVHDTTALKSLPTREKGPMAKTVPVTSVRPLSAVMDTALPQPLEDQAIASGILGIETAIKNHVQSFYHSSRVNAVLLGQDDLRGLGSNLPISTGTLSSLLSNPDTREMALRFCIAWVVLSRMQLSSPPDESFLPREIVECYEQMLTNRNASNNHNPLLCRWRMITAHLTQATYVRNSFTSSDPRQASVQSALKDLDDILCPFTDPRLDNKQRKQNLREILKRAAIFAFTLFSQPSTFDFDWQKEEGARSGTFCMFPALVQVRDETGERVSPPRMFSEANSRPL